MATANISVSPFFYRSRQHLIRLVSRRRMLRGFVVSTDETEPDQYAAGRDDGVHDGNCYRSPHQMFLPWINQPLFEVVGVCACVRSGACSAVGRLPRGTQEDAGRLLQNRLDAFDVCADGSSGVGNFETIKLCQQGINRDLRIQLGGEASNRDTVLDDASGDPLPGE